jgi:hypothetical protein
MARLTTILMLRDMVEVARERAASEGDPPGLNGARSTAEAA